MDEMGSCKSKKNVVFVVYISGKLLLGSFNREVMGVCTDVFSVYCIRLRVEALDGCARIACVFPAPILSRLFSSQVNLCLAEM
jgi:hypothetical protein